MSRVTYTGKPSRDEAAQGNAQVLSESEFRLFKDLIYEECGVSIGAEKRVFLESRLRRRMEEAGARGGYEYYCVLRRAGSGNKELAALLDALMICETSFFRNPPQFDLLREAVLPELVSRKDRQGGRQLRIWSAGCSTGQEPYSLAITALDVLGFSERLPLRVFASDLSFTALERAQAGAYRADQVKGLSQEQLRRYFREEGGHFLATDLLKKQVVFDYDNLKRDNGLRGIDVIFCRNVMIYFDAEEQRRLVNRFALSLMPGGYLFLGHAESLQGLSNRFSMVHRNKGIAYRLEA